MLLEGGFGVTLYPCYKLVVIKHMEVFVVVRATLWCGDSEGHSVVWEYHSAFGNDLGIKRFPKRHANVSLRLSLASVSILPSN